MLIRHKSLPNLKTALWAEAKINDPKMERRLFCFVPPSNSLVSVSDPWMAFCRPTRALCLASEHSKETRTVLNVCTKHRYPAKTQSETNDANLDCLSVKKPSQFLHLIDRKPRVEWPDLVWRKEVANGPRTTASQRRPGRRERCPHSPSQLRLKKYPRKCYLGNTAFFRRWGAGFFSIIDILRPNIQSPACFGHLP